MLVSVLHTDKGEEQDFPVYHGVVGLPRILGLVGLCVPLWAQIIEFESGGLKYQTLTKNGLTIMVASLPSHVRDYSILQVAISNGSPIPWTVKPEDFSYWRPDGQPIHATPARAVVNELMAKASPGRRDQARLGLREQSIRPRALQIDERVRGAPAVGAR